MLISVIVIIILLCDILTKKWAAFYLKSVNDIPVIPNILHLTYVENTGAAWGMMKNMRWTFVGITVIVVLLIIVFLYKTRPQNLWLKIGATFVLGGALGNLIDRAFLGYVVDFINVAAINFPVFNIADVFVCLGAVMVGIYYCFFDKKETGQ